MLIFLFVVAQTMPIGSSLNFDLEYLEGRGLIDLAESRPYEIPAVTTELSNLEAAALELRRYENHILRKMRPFVREDYSKFYLLGINSRYRSEPENHYVNTRLLFAGRIADRLNYSTRYNIQYAKTIEDSFPYPWHHFQFHIEDAEFIYTARTTKLEVGRKEWLLGPGRTGGLLLSDFSGSFNGFFMKTTSGSLCFTAAFSLAETRRYLALHRIELRRGRSSVSFSELILVGGALEPFYINPLVPYYVSQWIVNRDDNIMWALDGKFFVGPCKVYGELLIDDYRYDTVPPAPNKLGYLAGLTAFPAEGWLLGAEYVHIDKWVYTQRKAINEYVKDGKCIGHWLGPDADLYKIMIDYRTRLGLNAGFSPSLKRKGEGRIDRSWEEEGGDPNPVFPSGVVETTKELGFALEYFPVLSARVKVEYNRRWINNEDNVPGRGATKNVILVTTQIGI